MSVFVRYGARRLLVTLFVVWGALTVMFIAIRLAPGDPALLMLGPSATAEQVGHMQREMGLDKPIVVQYLIYLARICQGEFGESVRMSGSAMDLVVERLPITLTLGALAMTLALAVSIPLGVFAGRRRGTRADGAVSIGSLIGQALPSFWVGIMLILLFSRVLRVLPSGGVRTPDALILPVIVLAIPLVGSLVRLVRTGLLDVMGESYIRTARAKGLPESAVVYRHAVRNTMLPVVTVAGLQAGELLSGMVIVEVVFAVPGLGRLLVDSILYRDYATVQAAILVVAAIYALANLVVDLLYGVLDPRIRLAGATS